MALEQQINDAIKVAMRAKNRGELRSLRAIKSAILNAKTEKGASDEIGEDASLKILAKLVKQRKDSSSIFKEQGREDLMEKELEEIEVISRFLPEQITGDALVDKIKSIIETSGASSIKEMGKVMGLASKELSGQADGKEIAGIVRQLLQ